MKPELLKAVYAKNFARPSSIQGAALPVIFSGRNVIAQAHHGSGKTATFSLAMLMKVDPNEKVTQAICVCNTRELAIQIASVVTELARFTETKCYISFGGSSNDRTPITQQIVVGPPGSINNLFTSKRILKQNVKMLVFDEADVLVNFDEAAEAASAARGGRGGRGGSRGGRGGFSTGPQRDSIAKQAITVKNNCTQAQILLFSATFSEPVMQLAEKVCPNAVKFEVEREKVMLDNIVQLTVECNSVPDKLEQLKSIFSYISVKQVIIFCNTVAGAKELVNMLRADQLSVSVIYGKMESEERAKAVEDFRQGRTNVLITTNLLSRGFDVPNISFVVNFDIPVGRENKADPETYAHRVGRSGRFGRNGCAINFVHDKNSRVALETIEKEYVYNTVKVPRGNPELMQVLLSAALEGKKLDPATVKL